MFVVAIKLIAWSRFL